MFLVVERKEKISGSVVVVAVLAAAAVVAVEAEYQPFPNHNLLVVMSFYL